MFREMRRKEKLADTKEAYEILKRCNYGILSVIGDEGYPYGIPINYAVNDNEIIMHSALEGHKIDAIKNNDKVSFTVVSFEKLVPEKFTTKFESVVVFGKARFEEERKEEYLMELIDAHHSDYKDVGRKYVEKSAYETAVIVIEIEHITGKLGNK